MKRIALLLPLHALATGGCLNSPPSGPVYCVSDIVHHDSGWATIQSIVITDDLHCTCLRSSPWEKEERLHRFTIPQRLFRELQEGVKWEAHGTTNRFDRYIDNWRQTEPPPVAELRRYAEEAFDGRPAEEKHAEGAETESRAEDAETIDIPFYYEWANPGTPEEMRKALEPVQRTIDGLDRLVSSSCTINPSGRADYTVAFSTKGDTETGTRETIRILYEALDNVPVPDGAVLRVPVLVKGVNTPGVPAAQSPAEEKHAEGAETAEP